MRKIELLITQSRRATEAVEFNDTSGLTDEEFLQYANDAQDRLQSIISVLFEDIFQEEKVSTAVINQEEYPIPDDAFLGNRVDLIEFSPTGSSNDYYNLFKGSKKERLSGVSSTPSYYIRRSGSVLLEPAPQNAGLIRFTYQKTLPRLDKRRGTVSSVVLTTNAITSLFLSDPETVDGDALIEEGYITVVDKDGVVEMRRIPVTAFDSSTGEITIESGFTFDDGETIAANDYVCRGKESTTHSQLADNCERYLISYMNWKILKRDSSSDAIEQTEELKAMEGDILASFAEPDGDVSLIPILDGQFLTTDD